MLLTAGRRLGGGRTRGEGREEEIREKRDGKREERGEKTGAGAPAASDCAGRGPPQKVG